MFASDFPHEIAMEDALHEIKAIASKSCGVEFKVPVSDDETRSKKVPEVKV